MELDKKAIVPLTFVRVSLFTLEKMVYRDKLLCTAVDWFL